MDITTARWHESKYAFVDYGEVSNVDHLDILTQMGFSSF